MIERQNIIESIQEAHEAGARYAVAAEAVGLSLRTVERWKKDLRDDGRKENRFKNSNALSREERESVIAMACSSEFRDISPNQIVPILAENRLFLASESTFYRILKSEGLVKHRSRSRAPQRNRPEEFIATGPNRVWTWDISYLPTGYRGVFHYLYLILDIWDRSVVGWAVHEVESGGLAAELLQKTCMHHGVNPGDLVIHQDNGGPMISMEFLSVLNRWGRPSYSRPGVSDDNPYSEAAFRTLKYSRSYPGKFATIEDAVLWVDEFVNWYNTEHRHSGIGFVTPLQRRNGQAEKIAEVRRETYMKAKAKHPKRWSRNIRKWDLPKEVALNPRRKKKDRQDAA